MPTSNGNYWLRFLQLKSCTTTYSEVLSRFTRTTRHWKPSSRNQPVSFLPVCNEFYFAWPSPTYRSRTLEPIVSFLQTHSLIWSSQKRMRKFLDLMSLQHSRSKFVPTCLELLHSETCSDPTLPELGDYIRTGWPNSMRDVTELLHPYWCLRDELLILHGLMMNENKVIIPAAIRAERLKRCTSRTYI